MSYKQIMPAVDWYFKHDNTVWNLAAFALTDEGQVVGLVGAGDDGFLKAAPIRTKGAYLHRNQLTPEEIERADKVR